jgi:hypothetical protein
VNTLHQLLFDDTRTGGLGLVASTFQSDVDAVLGWQNDLKHFYRLSDDFAAPPDEAFSFLVFGADAAVLRRVNTGAQTGRNFSQAIVGPAEELSELAFPLTQWRGWLPPENHGHALEPSDTDKLRDLCLQYENTMRMRPSVAPNAVCALLAAIFANPEMDLSVLGVSSANAAEVLFAVRDIVTVIGGVPARQWTFSTFETSDRPRAHLPEFVFMPRLPDKPEIDDKHRVRVDVSETLPWDDQARLARAMYDEYRKYDWAAFQSRTRKAAGHNDRFVGRLRDLADRRLGTLNAYMPPPPRHTIVDEPVRETPELVTVQPEPEPPRQEKAHAHRYSLPLNSAPPVPDQDDFEELCAVTSAKELGEVLDRGNPDLSVSQLRYLWERWRTRLLVDVVKANAPIALRVRTFENVLVTLVDNRAVSPKEVDDWLANLDVPDVFHQQVADRAHGVQPDRRPESKAFLTWSDLPVVLFTTVIMITGILLTKLLERL